QRKHLNDGIGLIEGQLNTVLGEEQASQHPGSALVAINEWMIANDAKGIGSRKGCLIGLTISSEILRARKRRLKAALVARSSGTAVLGELLFMNRDRGFRANPAPLAHLASSRRIARSFLMISRASSISSTNSGSARRSSIPFGVRTGYKASPWPTPSCCSISFGKMAPVELPIGMSFNGLFIRML